MWLELGSPGASSINMIKNTPRSPTVLEKLLQLAIRRHRIQVSLVGPHEIVFHLRSLRFAIASKPARWWVEITFESGSHPPLWLEHWNEDGFEVNIKGPWLHEIVSWNPGKCHRLHDHCSERSGACCSRLPCTVSRMSNTLNRGIGKHKTIKSGRQGSTKYLSNISLATKFLERSGKTQAREVSHSPEASSGWEAGQLADRNLSRYTSVQKFTTGPSPKQCSLLKIEWHTVPDNKIINHPQAG